MYPAVGMMLFSRRARTTVTPPKSPLVKAAKDFFKRARKADAAPSDTLNDNKAAGAAAPKAAVTTKDNVGDDLASHAVQRNPTYEVGIAL